MERFPGVKKRLYIVRHGSTAGNEANRFQDGDIELSSLGREQAAFVAKRISRLPIDVILASTMARAHQTAECIAKAIDKEIISTDLLREILRPTAVHGKERHGPEATPIIREVYKNFATTGAQHSDEESFYAVKERAERAIDFVLARPEENLCVVTHGAFLKFLLARMMFGFDMTTAQFTRFHHFFHPTNTGISVVDYLPDLAPELPHDHSPWKCMVLNDHAHLA